MSGTSLHHSTLADQSSPESSPLAPSAFSLYRRGLESPISNTGAFSLPASLSESAIPSDDSDTTEEDNDLDFNLMIEASRANSVLSEGQNNGMTANSFSLFSHPRSTRLRQNNSKNSSRSGSASNSVMQSPSPTTPPIQQSSANPNYFVRPIAQSSSRISDDWRMSDSPASSGGSGNGSGADDSSSQPARDGPIRRAVSRRGDLHPKPKSFQRIKAYLQEEASPVDMELKREAEITRQLRDDDEEAEEEAERSAMLQDRDELAGFENLPLDRGMSFQKQAQKHGGFFFDAMDLGITGLGTSPPTFPRRQMDGDVMVCEMISKLDVGSNSM